MEQQKTTISQDFLYKFLQEHNMTTVMLSKKMGVSETIVGGCFRHALNSHGKPLSFSKANIVRLNNAIQQIASELRDCVITFGSDETFTNKRNKTYDPGTVPAIRRLEEYFNTTALTKRLLGWKNTRRNMVLGPKSSPVYGNVTKEDVDRLNAELLAVAGVLSSYEVVAVADDAKPADRQPATDDKGTRARTKPTAEQPTAHAWDNTDLTLQERSRLLHEQWPGGLLLFRVNNGYTAEGDDALYINNVDGSLSPYREPSSGLVTLWMDGDTMERLLPRLIADGRRVAITNMYQE